MNDGNVIYLAKSRLEEQAMNADKLVETMESLVAEAKSLSFGENGTHRSAGPCSDKMQIFTKEYCSTLGQMATMMKQLLDYIRNGAENIKEADEFLANTTVTVGVKPESEA